MAYNLLAIYESEQEQNYNKWFVMDENVYVSDNVGFTPPFQFSVPNEDELNVTALSSVLLVDFQTRIEVEILGVLESRGFEVYREENVNYDTVIYPSTLAIGDYQGEYFLKFKWSGGERTSEVFSMCDMSDRIKIEWWHNSNFCYPNGHFRYKAPFKFRAYIPSTIGKPSYEYSEKVITRAGIKFPLQQISFKLNKFVAHLPEFMVDAMRLIANHDNVEIFEGTRKYVVDEFLMESPNWLERGDLGEVVFEFKTDTVVVTNAKKKVNVEYVANEGTCILVSHICETLLLEGSSDYQNFQYTSMETGETVALENGDKVIIQNSSNELNFARFFTGPNRYELDIIENPETFFDANNNKYYFAPTNNGGATMVKPFVSSVSNVGVDGLAFGESFENVVVDVWVRFDQNGIIKEEKRGTGDSGLLKTTGVPFEWDDSILEVQLRTSSFNCPLFSIGTWYGIDLTGINFMQIENNFIID